jgi:hypothetical protein
MSNCSNCKNCKFASQNADSGAEASDTGKCENASPDEKTSITKGANGQRESHLHIARRFCLDCAGSSREVTFCTSWDCPLHPYRFGVLPKTFGNRLASEYSPDPTKAGGERHWDPDRLLIRSQPTYSPMQAIRLYCLWCNSSPKGVAECCNGNCPLHLLRSGKDPRRKKRLLTDEQKIQFKVQMNTAKGSIRGDSDA